MEGSSNSESPVPEPAVPPKKRRRWLRVFLIVLAILLALVLIAPYAIGFGFVRSSIEERASQQLRGKMRFGDLSFSWFSGVTAEQVVIDNPPGFPADRPCVRIKRLTGDVALGSLLFGSVSATADIDGLEVFVEQNADGVTNLQQLAKEDAVQQPGGEEPADPPGESPAPDAGSGIAFDVRLANSTVEVRRNGELLEAMRDLHVHARSSGDSSRVLVDGGAKLQAGDVAVHAEADPGTGSTSARLVSHGLDLARWQPLIEAFLPNQITALAGKIDGEIRADVEGEHVEVDGELIVAGPRVAGPIVSDMNVHGDRWRIAPTLALGTGADGSVDTSKFAIDTGWLRVDGRPSAAGAVALAYELDLAQLAEFGGPIPAQLKGSGAKLVGSLGVPTKDLPKDAAGWATAVSASADLRIPALDIAGVALRDLQLTTQLTDGSCQVSTGDESLLDGGVLAVDVQVDLTDFDTMPTTAKLTWRGGQLSGGATAALRYVMPLMAGLDPDIAQLVGKCDLEFDLEGPAGKPEDATWLAWLDNWRGSGTFALADAAFAPSGALNGLLAPLGPLTNNAIPVASDGRLAIDSFRAPFAFANGFIESKASEWLAKGQQIGLVGKVALDGQLEYSIDLSAMLEGHRDGERILAALGGKLPAAQLVGNVDSPELALPKLDNIAKKLLEQKGTELLKKGLNELLRGK